MPRQKGLDSELLLVHVGVTEECTLDEVLNASHEGGEVLTFELANFYPLSHEGL